MTMTWRHYVLLMALARLLWLLEDVALIAFLVFLWAMVVCAVEWIEIRKG
jgi:hypothetical protein